MKSIRRKGLMAIPAAALLLGLAACDRADDRMAGTHESANRPERAAADTRDETRAARSEARTETRDATASAGAAMDRAAQETRAMGAAAADKTRELGSAAATAVDDASITAKVNAALAADRDLSAMRIDVDTRNAVVTLSGPAPSASAKERAAEVALKVKGVASVNNQLTIRAG